MSFQNKRFCLEGDASCHYNGEECIAPSKPEPKRSHQWFMQTSENEDISNKKQAKEAVNGRPFSGNPDINFSLWENSSSVQPLSGQFTDRLFGEPIPNGNLSGSSILSVGVPNQAILLNNNPSTTKDNIISLGQPCENGLGATYEKVGLGINSEGNAFKKRDGEFTLMGRDFNKGFIDVLSMRPPHIRGNENGILLDQRFANTVANNIFSVGPAYGNGSFFMPMVNRSDSTMPVVPCNHIVDPTSSMEPVMLNYKDPSVSLQGLQNETGTYVPSPVSIKSYEGQICSEHLESETHGEASDPNGGATTVTTSKRGSVSKKKEPKTTNPNSFPSNVKSMLSTGIFDGVPVKYVSWSREKQLRGIIKGSSYLCSCPDCKVSKGLNAYDFERHAGCKTKHPNNHIHFENGKTVYAVAQELKNTSEDMLFDVIQTITGSPLDQAKFNTWKESYLAASRELLRIYGKDEVAMPS